MDDDPQKMTVFWEAVLSEQPEQVRGAVNPLDADTRAAVVAHLRDMACEPGWQPGQATAARAALMALGVEI